jgi:Nucleotidyl transferase AbiEii toxin, Type IV TA system
VTSEALAPAVSKRYSSAGVERVVIPHYPRDSMIRQKIRALAGRSTIQARDVFDLHLLAGGEVRNADIRFLRKALPAAELTEASDRALRITYRQFTDQVSEFLPDAERAALDEASREQRQLFVVDLIGEILGT